MNKKIIASLLLASTIAGIGASITPPTKVMASESRTMNQQSNVKILEDNSNFRIAETTENNITTKATLNKDTNIMNVTLTDSNTKDQLDTYQINLNQFKSEIVNQNDISTYGWSSYQKTFSNYEYFRYDNINGYKIVRPKGGSSTFSTEYKNAYYSGNNKAKLDTYVNQVEKINSQEKKVLLKLGQTLGVSAVGIVVSAIGNPAGLAALLAASGVAADGISMCVDLRTMLNSANNTYIGIVNNF